MAPTQVSRESALLDFCVESLERREHLSTPHAYDPGVDPPVGFNMASFVAEPRFGQRNWVRGVEELSATRAQEVTFAVYRQVDGTTGRFIPRSGPRLKHVRAAMSRAKQLGLTVTVTPIFEVNYADGDLSSWRGAWDPLGKVQERFQRAYGGWIRRLSRVAEKVSADRINVASEMQDFVRNPSNSQFLTDLVEQVDKRFSGKLGYVANWTNYSHASVDGLFWKNPRIDFLAISAYFSHRLATVSEADASQSMGSGPFEQLMAKRWSQLIEEELIPFAASRRVADERLPIVIQEFGATPRNRASVVPWSTTPGPATGATQDELDPAEQTALLRGLLRALDGHAREVLSVQFWTWSFESNRPDLFGLDPNHESPSQPAARAIQDFLQP